MHRCWNPTRTDPSRPAVLSLRDEPQATIKYIELLEELPSPLFQEQGSVLRPPVAARIEVTFTPTAANDRIGHVAIRDNAFGGTHSVGLLGKRM
jgi:hypothetical protein